MVIITTKLVTVLCSHRITSSSVYSVLVIIVDFMFPMLVCCSFPIRIARLAYLIPPIPATSRTDRAQAASRSSGASRCGLVPGKPCRIAQPASASPDPLLVLRIHQAAPVRDAVVPQAANPARLVALCTTAAGRSQAIG